MEKSYLRVNFDTKNDDDPYKSEKFWGEGKIFKLILGDKEVKNGVEVNWFGSSPAEIIQASSNRDCNLETSFPSKKEWIDKANAALMNSCLNIVEEVISKLYQRKFVLVVGNHGMGKSTLLRVISETGFDGKAICILKPDTSIPDLVKQIDNLDHGIVLLDDGEHILPKQASNKLHATLLLRAMDRARNRPVSFLGATSAPDALDPRLARFPCFDFVLHMRAPQLEERIQQLLGCFNNDAKLAYYVAQRTSGWTRAEIDAVARSISLAMMQHDDEGKCRETLLSVAKIEALIAKARHMTSVYRDNAMVSTALEAAEEASNDIKELDSHFTSSRLVGLESAIRTLDSAVISHFRESNRAGTNGVLLYGPSGNGKSLLGMELGKFVQSHGLANFLCVRCLDLVSKIIGDTEQNVAKVFQKARDCAPCLVFLDQIDAIAMRRDSGLSETTEKTFERVLSVLLVEMDGVMLKRTSVSSAPLPKVVVVASTAAKAMLDPAITRPGRLGTHVMVGAPETVEERMELVKASLRRIPNKITESFMRLICETSLANMSRAQITGILRESSTLALREDINAEYVAERHISEALEVAFRN